MLTIPGEGQGQQPKGSSVDFTGVSLLMKDCYENSLLPRNGKSHWVLIQARLRHDMEFGVSEGQYYLTMCIVFSQV